MDLNQNNACPKDLFLNTTSFKEYFEKKKMEEK